MGLDLSVHPRARHQSSLVLTTRRAVTPSVHACSTVQQDASLISAPAQQRGPGLFPQQPLVKSSLSLITLVSDRSDDRRTRAFARASRRWIAAPRVHSKYSNTSISCRSSTWSSRAQRAQLALRHHRVHRYHIRQRLCCSAVNEKTINGHISSRAVSSTNTR